MTKSIRNLLLSCSVASMPSTSALAQESAAVATNNVSGELSREPQIQWRGSFDSSYVGGSTSKFQGAHLADSDAFNFGVKAGVRLPLDDKWSLEVALKSDNFYLDQVAGAPVPESIHTARFDVGVGYHLNDKWQLTGVLSPSLYRFEDVQLNDFGISFGGVATYKMNPSLTWSMGLIVAPDNDLPVLPVVGLRWDINDRYTLDLGMPKTRLSYHLDPKWTFYGGANLEGTTFRASEDLGTKTGFPRYNNGLATYREVGIGLGASYEIVRGLRAELEAGSSVYREINYTRIDEEVKFEPAPYVRLGLNLRF